MLAVAVLLGSAPALARESALVDAAWLRERMQAPGLLLLDTQPAKLHEAGHIPGAVHVDLFAYGPDEADAALMQRRIRSWGVSAGRKIVIYDQGGATLRRACSTSFTTGAFPWKTFMCSTAGLPSGALSVAP
jgi:thiosulfate/3-mercaptopyruvate sulfurtransferase